LDVAGSLVVAYATEQQRVGAETSCDLREMDVDTSVADRASCNDGDSFYGPECRDDLFTDAVAERVDRR
jgi:hypothetical protein